MKQERGHFRSKIGVILATAGSAVGLGNIWRFPYMTGHDGGAAFIFLYIICVLLLGVPGMVAEFVVGRHTSANAAKAYREISGGGGWSVIGYMGVFTSMVILGFYAVVAGWCLEYFFASVAGNVVGYPGGAEEAFRAFSTNSYLPMVFTVAFILLTHAVVTRGVRKGIERASNLLMPLLFILLLVLVVASCMLPGASAGIRFLFKPDFSQLSSGVMLDALGQAFFSLSLGTACLCTYASYFSRQTNLARSASQIAGIDTLVAILAGLIIFPAAFSVGVNPDSGPSLIFITLPEVFCKAFGGVPVVEYAVAVLFYALMVLAALTSTISMHEIGTSFFSEELGLPRGRGAWLETGICAVIGIFCALSSGAVPELRLFGLSLMECCDFLTSNILLPFGSFLTCLLVGWVVPRRVVEDEFTNWHTLRGSLFGVWLFVIRFVCPVCIAAVFLHQLRVI